MISTVKNTRSSRLFTGISWGVTGLIVIALLGVAFQRFVPAPLAEPTPIPVPTSESVLNSLPAMVNTAGSAQALVLHLALKTVIDTTVNYKITKYTVQRGDSIFGIADKFKLKPETVYWANVDLFQGSPDNLKAGQVLSIPPVDGVYYQWQKDDQLDAVAKDLGVDPEMIINWPGNNIDLGNPQINVGDYVMIPGGKRTDQPLFIQTASRSSSPAAAACGGGYPSRGYFIWPAPNHWLSGNDWQIPSGHQGIDVAAGQGTPIYAADNGVVTMASGDGSWNYGYGNVVQIDHGNGFVSLYGHLSQVFVKVCDPVLAGATIGLAGDTGNAFGAHLHFEIRYQGVARNPRDFLPPP